MDRRAQLSEALTREEHYLAKSPSSIEASIQRMIGVLQEEIESIDQVVRELLANNREMGDQDRLFQSVQGIGPVTSWSIIAYLGDISQLKRNQLVAYAGVLLPPKAAERKQASGPLRGRKANVRRSLYMAAKSAATHNPVIRDYVEGFRKRGKPYEIALVAAMRKLLMHLQSLAKKQRNSS